MTSSNRSTSVQWVAEEGNDNLECIRVALHVWNGTQWVAYTGANIYATDLTVTMDDVEKAASGSYWRKTIYEYDSDDNVIYKGFHTTYNVADADTGHFIIKYTYTSGNLTLKQMAVGAWTGRVALFA